MMDSPVSSPRAFLARRAGRAGSLHSLDDIDTSTGSPRPSAMSRVGGGGVGSSPAGPALEEAGYTPTQRPRSTRAGGSGAPAPDRAAVADAAASLEGGGALPREEALRACGVLRDAAAAGVVGGVGTGAPLTRALADFSGDSEVVAAAAGALLVCARGGTAFTSEFEAVAAVAELVAAGSRAASGDLAFAAAARALGAIAEDATLAPIVARALSGDGGRGRGGSGGSIIARGLRDPASEASAAAAARLIAVLCRPFVEHGGDSLAASSVTAPPALADLRPSVPLLLDLLACGALSVRVEAAAAVASLARHPAGRAMVLEAGGLPRVLGLLMAPDEAVRAARVYPFIDSAGPPLNRARARACSRRCACTPRARSRRLRRRACPAAAGRRLRRPSRPRSPPSLAS
jgi:hypothetical protein